MNTCSTLVSNLVSTLTPRQRGENRCKSRGKKRRKNRQLPKLILLAALGLTGCQQRAPTASLQASPAEVAVGEPVTLTWRSVGAEACDLTTGQQTLTPESCTQGSVTASYDRPGTFTATFVYTADNGSELRREALINVSAAGTSQAFTAEQNGLTVTFTAAAPPEASLVWDFGDGETGSGARVTHTYAQAGDYPVTLTQTHAGERTQSTQTVTVKANTPARTTLFSGNGLAAWKRVRGGAANWRTEADYVEVKPGGKVGDNNLRTKETFGDFRLHLEFWVPKTPAGTPEQARGNSGVYLQGRYEVQILDSYGRTLSGQNDAGAVYEVKNAVKNASLPPETWQSYDLEFRAARFEGKKKVQDARVSVVWNGQLVQDETVIPGPTRLGNPERSSDVGSSGVLLGPIVLQDHGYKVRFRNVWLESL